MKITFYKNCCLNNKYQEVFYNTKLETYLNSLEHFSLTLDDTYYENDMELVFDYQLLIEIGGQSVSRQIYDYNYCKIEEINGLYFVNNLTRYLFIKHIEVKNGCVYLETEEDVWASYSGKMQGTNTCILVNSRRTSYGSGMNLTPLELPYNYDGNNKLVLNSISYANLDYPYVYMLVEFQLYNLNDYSEPNADRDVFYAVVRFRSQDYNASITFLESNARKLMSSMSTVQIRGKQYQVGNIFAIPVGMLDVTNDFDTEFHPMEDLYMRECKNPKEHIVLSGTLTNNYKNLFIGALDNYISLINNGTTISYEITFSCCDAGISLKLNCSNQIIDITNSFKYDVPFQGILSEEYATRSVANSLKESKIRAEKEQTKIHSVIEGYQAGMSFFDTLFGINPFVSASGMGSHIENAVMGAEGVGLGKQQVYDWEKLAIRAPKYSNSKGVINNLNTIAPICYGLVVGRINPDNSEFVKAFVDNYGYSCYFFINSQSRFESILKTDLYNENQFNYNIVRITSPNVYGSFTNDIANKLNDILSNGVKIWYDATRTLDGYTDSLLN